MSNTGPCGNEDRTIIFGGWPTTRVNEIQYKDISTSGNTTDFGDLTSNRDQIGGANNATRATANGGWDSWTTNKIEYVSIASTGNSSDFGDLIGTPSYPGAASGAAS